MGDHSQDDYAQELESALHIKQQEKVLVPMHPGLAAKAECSPCAPPMRTAQTSKRAKPCVALDAWRPDLPLFMHRLSQTVRCTARTSSISWMETCWAWRQSTSSMQASRQNRPSG